MNRPQELIQDLVARLGLDNAPLGENGGCCLIFDQRTRLSLEPSTEGGRLHLHSEVATVPVEGEREFMVGMLRANYLGHGTEQAVLSINPSTQRVEIHLNLDPDVEDIETLTDLLPRFVRTVQHWTERLAGRIEDASISAPHSTDSGDTELQPVFMIRV